MKHISTRGRAPPVDFDDIVLSGLAPDGGLYVPQAWPSLSADDLRRFAGMPYAAVAADIVKRFAGPETALDIESAVHEAYAGFRDPAIAPLRRLDGNLWLLELFHGPTFAFKDFALQVLGRLIVQRLAQTGRTLVVVAATSGDTGSAAIAALADRPGVEAFVLHPKDRVSEIQRRQMTATAAANIHNIALEGDFDAAQALVKALFNDQDFAADYPLGAINSINWARLAVQTVYFVTASLALGRDGPVDFVVPTGNFGDIFSGYAAKRMGAPVGRLIAATNENDIVARALTTGDYARGVVTPTQSPSMDIQVASNFERLLFDAMGREPLGLTAAMEEFAAAGRMRIPPDAFAAIRNDFEGYRAPEADVEAAIAAVSRAGQGLIDPHTAAGVAVARALNRPGRTVCLATAHPAKFGPAVQKAAGRAVDLPEELQGLMRAPERFTVLPGDIFALKAFIRSRAAAKGRS
jgi:threonine synthase